ncbi:MAG: hypothetical protein IT353_23775 [Gemmatimonadaceae bacterium]|nr:hypothetical protein [Gemmatimonadaceae bacterium]
MRQYKYQATDETYEVLRRLRGAWSRVHVAETAVTVVLVDGSGIVIQVEAADVEDAFEAFRLTAFVDPAPMVYGDAEPLFARGGNDVVVFTGATWSEPGAQTKDPLISQTASVHFSGHPGQISDAAEVVCLTSDAFVVANLDGVGLLVRTGLKPYSLECERDAVKVRAFLIERGYVAEDPEPFG